MQATRVGAAILNQTALDLEGNCARIVRAIEAARQRGVQILVCPELCITGYGAEDRFLSRDLCRKAFSQLIMLAPHVRTMAAVVGLPLWYDGVVYNTAAVILNGELLGLAAKQHLANDGIHYEKRWFREWPRGKAITYESGGTSVPLGALRFDIGGLRIGFEICEDAWVQERPAKQLAEEGVSLILNPSASHFQCKKQETRKRLVREGSRLIKGGYVLANLVGNEAGRAIYDGGSLIGCDGEIIAEGRRFSFEEVAICSADLELSTFPPGELPSECVVTRHTEFPPVADFTKTVSPLPDPYSSKEEEFCGAVALGLFDYMRKSVSSGFVLSLSGGADSAAIAALVAIMTRRVIRQLGLATLRERLPWFSELQQATTEEEVLRAMLACVYQKTANSSTVTEEAARAVAAMVGATYLLWEVTPSVDWYRTLVERSLGRSLTWQDDGLALQNIQARVRAPGVWLLANVRKSLLLVTSNRSEASVGYATMDGDTSGGLAPIAGIDKEYLRQWLLWLEREGPHDIGAFPQMRLVNVQAPTAELRPLADQQTDEKDLMPYKVLNEIERLYVQERCGPTALTSELINSLGSLYTPENLRAWAQKFLRLWRQSQWKRERFAPSFHLDDRSVDSRSWCRFPILSGGE